MKSEINIGYHGSGVSDPEILRHIKQNIAKNEDASWEIIKDVIPKISSRLHDLGLDDDWVDYAILRLSQMKEDYPAFLSMDFDMFNQVIHLPEIEGKLTPFTLALFLANFPEDNDLFRSEEFRKKLFSSLESYAYTHPEEELSMGKQKPETITRFNESDSLAISSRLAYSLMESGLPLALDNYGGSVYTKKGRRNETVGTDFFRSDKEMVFVRCGYLFFIDSRYQNLIPEDAMKAAGNNIVFIRDMPNSEFGCRLGYFTCNTLVTLMNVDLRNKTVVDCGSGTSNLSLGIKKLGAAKVLGFDNDPKQLEKAVANIAANGEENTVIPFQQDLLKMRKVTKLVGENTISNEIVIVANLGYWREYPISNLTCISLVNYFSEAGLIVTDVITGGNDPMVGANHRNHEALFLNSCLSGKQEPGSGMEQDKICLKSLGYAIKTTSESEVITNPGSFPRTAGSVHGSLD